VVGPHCEVVVYDFDDLEHAVVAVVGNVTGRKVGAPVPDLLFTSDALNRDTPDQLNYRTKIGSRELQSSLIWLRDQTGRPLGAVGINIDYGDLIHIRDLIDKLATSTRNVGDMIVSDTFAKDLDDLIHISVQEYLHREQIPDVETMSYEEKLCLIQEVESRGLFKIRGAVNQVADLLNVSRATVYNYRSNLKQDELSETEQTEPKERIQ
jgi:predicted transcriptional regulator YheO